MSNRKDKNWSKFERHVRETLIPTMKESKSVLVISPDVSTAFDVRFAVQIGASVLLEKPLIVVVPDHVNNIPPKLERIADRIIRADLSSEQGRKDAEALMKQAFTDFAKQ